MGGSSLLCETTEQPYYVMKSNMAALGHLKAKMSERGGGGKKLVLDMNTLMAKGRKDAFNKES